MQHIVVCTQDSVLAKKVRFLLARDECEVEILSNPGSLGDRLSRGGLAMLVLSRELDGEDALEVLAEMGTDVSVPTTLVLGGEQTATPDYIHLIPDPIDTQAIYRIASEVLVVDQDDAEEVTHMAVDAPKRRRRTMIDTNPPGAKDENSFGDVSGLDEIAGRLEELDGDERPEQLGETYELIEDDDDVGKTSAGLRPGAGTPVLGGMLEPARFAKVLYECWAQQTTGALIVARDRETLTISFEEGAPVHVQSSVPGDPLGRALVGRGRISDTQYAEGAKRAIEKGLLLGAALVELGYFTTEELGDELGKTAKEQIASCFEARQGAFELDPKRTPPTTERPYRLDVPHIVADGLRKHADQEVVRSIVGDIGPTYFRIRRTIDELQSQFPLNERDIGFLEYNGRAYNVSDAAEICRLTRNEAHSLMALLTITDEVTDFTPGVSEFEARIREERERSRDIRPQGGNAADSSVPLPTPAPAKASLPPIALPSRDTAGQAASGSAELPSAGGESAVPLPPSDPPIPAMPSPPVQSSPPPPPAVGPNGEEIPAMPVPSNGEDGMPIRPLVFANPLPRGPDGSTLETPERSLSREHFQRGVSLLGQGNFANAEEAFRDAIALCAEEHVYLIGLARAIYYNPAYRADGKVPVLQSIVGRADHLAPDDKRVATLKSWVSHAEAQLPAMM